MSITTFNPEDFCGCIPKKILKRTQENMEVYHMNLNDSFQEAVKTFAKKGTEL